MFSGPGAPRKRATFSRDASYASVERAASVNRGEENYIKPYKSNAAIQIDSFHDYEPCILAKYLLEIPQFRQELTDEFMAENDLTDLMKVVRETDVSIWRDAFVKALTSVEVAEPAPTPETAPLAGAA